MSRSVRDPDRTEPFGGDFRKQFPWMFEPPPTCTFKYPERVCGGKLTEHHNRRPTDSQRQPIEPTIFDHRFQTES